MIDYLDSDILRILAELEISYMMYPDPPLNTPEYWVSTKSMLAILNYRAKHEYHSEHIYNRSILGKICRSIEYADLLFPQNEVMELSGVIARIRKIVFTNRVAWYNARDGFKVALDPEKGEKLRKVHQDKVQSQEE